MHEAPSLLNQCPTNHTKVQTALSSPTIAITPTPKMAFLSPTKETEPLFLDPDELDDDDDAGDVLLPVAAAAMSVGVNVAEGLATQDVAAKSAAEVDFEARGFTVAFPEKSHACGLRLFSS